MDNFFDKNNDDHWMATSDLMAGLMMIFLIVAIFSILEPRVMEAREKEDVLRELRQDLTNLKAEICSELEDEFTDADELGIQICEDALLVRFKDTNALFETSKAELKPEFEEILEDFFPRYVEVLENYFEDIDEVRIEGHTDDQPFRGVCGEDKFCNYIENMKLSQARTSEVMRFVLSLDEAEDYEEWFIKNMTANGLSSSRFICWGDTICGDIKWIDRGKSRRVEFAIRLKDEL